MDRRNQILALLLVIQIALVGWFFFRPTGSTAAAGKLLPDLQAANVNGLTVQEKDKSVKLAKSGDNWVLPDNGDFPVEAVKVTDLISKLLTIDTGRLVASNASSYNRLKVADDDYVKRIELTTADGKTQTLLIGTAPNARATNVRLGGTEPVYLASQINAFEISTDISGWINTVYVQAPQDQMQSVSISNANGTIAFTKVNTTTWTLADLTGSELFNSNNFSTIQSRLNSMQMVEPLGRESKPEYGLDKPSAVVTVTLQAPGEELQTLTLQVGAKDADAKNYYAKSSASEYYAKIATFTLDQFVTDTRDRYLQPPPTPEASSSITSTTPITGFASFPAAGTTPEPATPVTTTSPLTATGDLTATAPISPAQTTTNTQP